MIKLAPDVFTTSKQDELLLLKIDNDEVVYKLSAFEAKVFQSILKHKNIKQAVESICQVDGYNPAELTVFAEKLVAGLEKLKLVNQEKV